MPIGFQPAMLASQFAMPNPPQYQLGQYQQPQQQQAQPGGGVGDALKSPPGIGTALNLAGQFASYLGDRGRRKQNKADFQQSRSELKGQLGQQVFDPYLTSNLAYRAAQPEFEGYGRQLDTTLGLDYGRGIGALREGQIGHRLGQLGGNIAANQQMMSARDMAIYEALFGEAAARNQT